jgi:hypothetical protein
MGKYGTSRGQAHDIGVQKRRKQWRVQEREAIKKERQKRRSQNRYRAEKDTEQSLRGVTPEQESRR